MGNGSLTTGLLGRLYSCTYRYIINIPAVSICPPTFIKIATLHCRHTLTILPHTVICPLQCRWATVPFTQGGNFQICNDACLICNHICPNCKNICPNCKNICLQHCPGTHTVICPLQIGRVDGQMCNFQRRKFVK